MRVKEIIAADKAVTDWGVWADGGKMSRSTFPLSKPKGRFYRLGWRVVQFTALDTKFRLLIAYHLDKEQYRSVLALERDRDMTVLAQYEFHGTHEGWHLLVACEHVEGLPAGAMRFPGQKRLPKARAKHRDVTFGIRDDNHALERAVQRFRLRAGEETFV